MSKSKVRKQLARLLEPLKLGKDYDFVIVSDGSGTTWKTACGWASVLVRNDGSKMIFHGALNHGTNNVAELMGCIQPLLYMMATELYNEQGTTVLILTDSEYVANGVNSKIVPKKNSELWTLLLSASKYAIRLQAKWIPRASNEFNVFADNLASICRTEHDKIPKLCAGDSPKVAQAV